MTPRIFRNKKTGKRYILNEVRDKNLIKDLEKDEEFEEYYELEEK